MCQTVNTTDADLQRYVCSPPLAQSLAVVARAGQIPAPGGGGAASALARPADPPNQILSINHGLVSCGRACIIKVECGVVTQGAPLTVVHMFAPVACSLHPHDLHHAHQPPFPARQQLHTFIHRCFGGCLISRNRYIAWVKCPYSVVGKASALCAGKRSSG